MAAGQLTHSPAGGRQHAVDPDKGSAVRHLKGSLCTAPTFRSGGTPATRGREGELIFALSMKWWLQEAHAPFVISSMEDGD